MSLTTSHFIPFPREEVWDWHTRKGAVTRLSPPFVPFTPIQQAERLSDGTTIFSLPAGLKWVARHDLSGYLKGNRFTDVCTSAPVKALANWRHVHNFVDQDGGTLITDSVSTRVPGIALTSMFAYRQHQLLEDMLALQRFRELGDDTPLTIAMTGSRGLIGRALTAQLQTGGHTVVQLVRGEAKPWQRTWDPERPAQDLLKGIDVLIHLAGEPIFGRFNDSHKDAIRNSRVKPTRKLAELVAASDSCHTMVSASAIGFYGPDRGDEELNEQSPTGGGFLADVVRGWEKATEPASRAGKRVAMIRTGVALSGRGGMLPVLKTLFSTGLGGQFGDGSNWFSWIALDDLTDIFYRAVIDRNVSGPINATAPNPVTNEEMTKVLASQLHRPAFFQIPTIGPKIILGRQGAEELALSNQKVLPTALQELGHVFRYTTIDAAIAHELGGEELADAAATREQVELEAGEKNHEKKQTRLVPKAARRAPKAEEAPTDTDVPVDDAEVEETIRTSILNFRRRRNG